MEAGSKSCKDCGRTKPLSKFYVNKVIELKSRETRTYHSPYCKECHGKRVRSAGRDLQDRNLLRIWEFFETHPCRECGEDNPIKLSFDHRDPKQKSATLSDLMKKKWPHIERELAKCDVLCHNCHAVKTAAQFNWFKAPELRDYVESWPENKNAYTRAANDR